MELELQKARENTLKRLNVIRNCVLAQHLCRVIRTYRHVLTLQDVNRWCTFVGELCKTMGCAEQATLCCRAAEVVLKDEQKYLNLCVKSCKKCGQIRPKVQGFYVA